MNLAWKEGNKVEKKDFTEHKDEEFNNQNSLLKVRDDIRSSSSSISRSVRFQ